MSSSNKRQAQENRRKQRVKELETSSVSSRRSPRGTTTAKLALSAKKIVESTLIEVIEPTTEVIESTTKVIESTIDGRRIDDERPSTSTGRRIDDERPSTSTAKQNVKRVTKVQSQAAATKTIGGSVPCSPRYKLKIDDLFGFDSVESRQYKLRMHLILEGRIEEDAALLILEKGSRLFQKEDNLIYVVQRPVIICGDINGHFYDLLRVFELGGKPGFNNSYLFLGNYGNRGHFGIECVLYLWFLKICAPESIFLLRGSHDCRHLTEFFTFKRECLVKYSQRVYDACMMAFDNLPLAAIIYKFFCVHSGISPELRTLEDINRIDRFREPPPRGLMCDLLWSDPTPYFGNEHVKVPFKSNTMRGCSYFYGIEAWFNFMVPNNLMAIIRSHEVEKSGFYNRPRKFNSLNNPRGFPQIISIFSAPNFVDLYKNDAVFLTYNGSHLNFKQIIPSPHPFCLPNFMDAFTWSLPFVAEKTTQAIVHMAKLCGKREKMSADREQEEDDESSERIDEICNIIESFGTMSCMFASMREKHMAMVQQSNHTFFAAQRLDARNIRMPPHPETVPVEEEQEVVVEAALNVEVHE